VTTSVPRVGWGREGPPSLLSREMGGQARRLNRRILYKRAGNRSVWYWTALDVFFYSRQQVWSLIACVRNIWITSLFLDQFWRGFRPLICLKSSYRLALCRRYYLKNSRNYMLDEDFMVTGHWETLDGWFDEYSDICRPVVVVSRCLADNILSLFGSCFRV